MQISTNYIIYVITICTLFFNILFYLHQSLIYSTVLSNYLKKIIFNIVIFLRIHFAYLDVT